MFHCLNCVDVRSFRSITQNKQYMFSFIRILFSLFTLSLYCISKIITFIFQIKKSIFVDYFNFFSIFFINIVSALLKQTPDSNRTENHRWKNEMCVCVCKLFIVFGIILYHRTTVTQKVVWKTNSISFHKSTVNRLWLIGTKNDETIYRHLVVVSHIFADSMCVLQAKLLAYAIQINWWLLRKKKNLWLLRCFSNNTNHITLWEIDDYERKARRYVTT